MASFKKSDTKVFRSKLGQVPESAYWKKLEVPVLIKEFGPVDYINFVSSEPSYFAATSSARVQVYNPVTKQVYKNLNKFKETAYGGSFRNDGQLLCAGSEEPVVRLFDVSTRTLLRRFKGHTGAVHRTYFTSDNTHIASFSDDNQVMLWDIATESRVTQFKDHSDYIRAGCICSVSPNMIMSGSYDKTVKMYDTRDKSVIFTMDHGAPVESVLFSPSGSIFVSAGGKEVRVWDVFTRSLLTKFTQYHKTVTCMCYSAKGKRLLTGSLDKRVKVIDTKTYRVLHTMSYPSPILSIGVSEDEKILATGMVNGLLSIQKRAEVEHHHPKKEPKKIPRRYFGDTISYDATIVDRVVPNSEERAQLPTYENALRKFQYSKALDSVMIHRVAFKKPSIVITVFSELIRRRGLLSAVSGRDSKQLAQILRFIIRYLCVDRFTKILIEVSDTIIDAYFDIIETYSMEVKNLFKTLRNTVKQEENITRQLLELQGALEMLFSSSSCNSVQ